MYFLNGDVNGDVNGDTRLGLGVGSGGLLSSVARRGSNRDLEFTAVDDWARSSAVRALFAEAACRLSLRRFCSSSSSFCSASRTSSAAACSASVSSLYDARAMSATVVLMKVLMMVDTSMSAIWPSSCSWAATSFLLPSNISSAMFWMNPSSIEEVNAGTSSSIIRW